MCRNGHVCFLSVGRQRAMQLGLAILRCWWKSALHQAIFPTLAGHSDKSPATACRVGPIRQLVASTLTTCSLQTQTSSSHRRVWQTINFWARTHSFNWVWREFTRGKKQTALARLRLYLLCAIVKNADCIAHRLWIQSGKSEETNQSLVTTTLSWNRWGRGTSIGYLSVDLLLSPLSFAV